MSVADAFTERLAAVAGARRVVGPGGRLAPCVAGRRRHGRAWAMATSACAYAPPVPGDGASPPARIASISGIQNPAGDAPATVAGVTAAVAEGSFAVPPAAAGTPDVAGEIAPPRRRGRADTQRGPSAPSGRPRA